MSEIDIILGCVGGLTAVFAYIWEGAYFSGGDDPK